MKYGILIIIIFIIIMIKLLNDKNKKQVDPVTDLKKYKYQDFIEKAALKYDIPAGRLYGHMMQESSGNPSCVGAAGERGLMQLKIIAFEDVQRNFPEFVEINFSALWDPEINLAAGAAYLSLCRKWTGGDLDAATQAYNVGIGTYLKNKNAGFAYLEKVIHYEEMV